MLLALAVAIIFRHFDNPVTLQLTVHIVIVQLPQIIGEPLVPDCQQTEEGGLASPLTAYQAEHDFNLHPG